MTIGYLSEDDRERQAEAFAESYDRTGGDWRRAFARWGGPHGKDFQPGDMVRIRALAHELLFADGTTTEPPAEWAA